jgi:flagellar basal-body rod protein FlgB
VIANNVANVDVPRFKRSDVVFEELLADKLRTGKGRLPLRTFLPGHLPSGGGRVPEARVVTDRSTSLNHNGNNVDIDREMALMAKNQLRYNLLVQQINHEVRMLRIGITGGR